MQGHALERHWAELAGFCEVARPTVLGLFPRQADAAAILASRLRRWRCAVLADPVGSGKSYTALGAAELLGGAPTIVCPAPLVRQWESLLQRSGLCGEVVSDGLLSRRRVGSNKSGPVIVDEGHRFRNLSTRRRASLLHLVRYRSVLWLTATPVWNSRRDLLALIRVSVGPALFENAVGIDRDDAWKLVDRRVDVWNCVCERFVLRRGSLTSLERRCLDYRPNVVPDELSERIDRSAPSSMVFEGEPRELFRRGVARALASSSEAAGAMLNRALLFLIRLQEAQRTGGTLSRNEFLSAFGLDGVTAQCVLPFWFQPGETAVEGLEPIIRELSALVARLERHPFASSEKLEVLVRSLGESKIALVFTEYQATAEAVVGALPERFRPALLTGKTCRIRGVGALDRASLLRAFVSGDASLSEPIRTLVMTPLGAEGLNLQVADTVVHADLPWSHARLEQRVGRADRIGGHGIVRVVTLRPPEALESICAIETTLRRKAGLAPIPESPEYQAGSSRPTDLLGPCVVEATEGWMIEVAPNRFVVRRGDALATPSEMMSALASSAWVGTQSAFKPPGRQRSPGLALTGRTFGLLRSGRHADAKSWLECLEQVFGDAGDSGEAALREGHRPEGMAMGPKPSAIRSALRGDSFRSSLVRDGGCHEIGIPSDDSTL